MDKDFVAIILLIILCVVIGTFIIVGVSYENKIYNTNLAYCQSLQTILQYRYVEVTPLEMRWDDETNVCQVKTPDGFWLDPNEYAEQILEREK